MHKINNIEYFYRCYFNIFTFNFVRIETKSIKGSPIKAVGSFDVISSNKAMPLLSALKLPVDEYGLSHAK